MRRSVKRLLFLEQSLLPRPRPTVPLIVMADEWNGVEGEWYTPDGRKRKSPLIVIAADTRDPDPLPAQYRMEAVEAPALASPTGKLLMFSHEDIDYGEDLEEDEQ